MTHDSLVGCAICSTKHHRHLSLHAHTLTACANNLAAPACNTAMEAAAPSPLLSSFSVDFSSGTERPLVAMANTAAACYSSPDGASFFFLPSVLISTLNTASAPLPSGAHVVKRALSQAPSLARTLPTLNSSILKGDWRHLRQRPYFRQ